MKRREFIKISSLSAAALAIIGPAVAKKKTIEGVWVDEDLFVYPKIDYEKKRVYMNKIAPVPNDIVRFYNGVMGFIPGKGRYTVKASGGPIKFELLVVPIEKGVCLDECENMVCMVLNNAIPDEKT